MQAGSGRDSTDHKCLNWELGMSHVSVWLAQVIFHHRDLLGGQLEIKTMQSHSPPVL